MKTIKPFFVGAFTSSANEYQLSAAVSLIATAAANVRQCSEAVHGSAAAATTASSSTRYGPAAAADSIHYLPAGPSAAASAAGSSCSAASCQYPTASTKRLTTTTTTETHTPTTSSAPGTPLHQCFVSTPVCLPFFFDDFSAIPSSELPDNVI